MDADTARRTGVLQTVRARVMVPNPSPPPVTRYFRENDIQWGDPASPDAIEVKLGPAGRANRSSNLCVQAAKDRELLDTRRLASKVWHFVPSADGVGPDADLLQCLASSQMPFVIHIPTT